MDIRNDNFGGMIPSISDPRNLPDNAAQRAVNVDLRSAKLQPMKITKDFTAMHSTDTLLLKPGLPRGDIRFITKPDPPSELFKFKLCDPITPDEYVTNWLAMNARIWESHVNSSGIYVENNIVFYGALNKSVEYTDDGFIIHTTVPTVNYSFLTDTLYTLYGPNWIVLWEPDTAFRGGPEASGAAPPTSTAHDGPLPFLSLPLLTPFPENYGSYPDGPETDRYVYGTLSLEDVDGPVLPRTLYFNSDNFGGASSVTYGLHSAQYVSFRFSCNYVQPRRVYVNYAMSNVDQRVVEGTLQDIVSSGTTELTIENVIYGEDDDVPADFGKVVMDGVNFGLGIIDYTTKSYDSVNNTWTLSGLSAISDIYNLGATAYILDPNAVGREGPPSDYSERIQLLPGEGVKLATTRSDASYFMRRLYRTEDTSIDPRLLDRSALDIYYDTNFIGLGETLPPFGNYPNATVEDALARSVVHPNNFSVISDGKVLYLSDIERTWVYPEEYTIEYLSTIMANPIVGRSIIVFTAGDEDKGIPAYVYRVGGFRDQTSSDELTDARPLLNVLSLCKIDGSMFYVSADGLMQVTEGGVRNVSEEWFTKNEWNECLPSILKAYVNDGVIYLTGTGCTNWRMDLKRGVAAVTTFTELPQIRGTAEMSWTSKIHTMPRLTRHSFCRVRATGYPVLLEIFNGRGRMVSSIKIGDDRKQRLPKCELYDEMFYRVSSFYEVKEVALANSAAALDITVSGERL